MRESHSDKGLKTLTLMNTKPDDWGLTPIKWVWEKITAPVEQECGLCHGRGRTYIRKDGTYFDKQAAIKNISKGERDYSAHYKIEDYMKKHGIEYGRCPGCPQKKSRTWGNLDLGTGKIIVMKKVDILVGYPIWPKGVQFDSRFHDQKYYRNTGAHSVCELCSKSIFGRWSFLVPVNAKGPDGKVHGMYVGEDCARKFLGLELVLDMNQLQEIKKSERKQHVQIRMTTEGAK